MHSTTNVLDATAVAIVAYVANADTVIDAANAPSAAHAECIVHS